VCPLTQFPLFVVFATPLFSAYPDWLLACTLYWRRQFNEAGDAMKTWTFTSLAAVTVLGMAMQAAAQQTSATEPVRQIVVSLEDRKLALIEDGQVKKIYSVAVGKPSTPSPEGTFTIERRVVNPVYHRNGRTVDPGPGNPAGTRWMALSTKGYGIHGTNEPNSIGKAASHGCIRMAKADLEEFYALVAVGDQVQIVGARNEQTARLFEPAQPVASPKAAADATMLLPKVDPAMLTPVHATSQELEVPEIASEEAKRRELAIAEIAGASQ
jgi:L,D-transpeptidase catalytic domain